MKIKYKMNQTTIFLILLPTLIPGILQAQESQEPREAFYFELGGSGGAYSLNYDRMYREKWAGRTGIGFFFDFSRDDFFSRATGRELRWRNYGLTLPVMGSYLIGRNKKFLELGTSLTLIWASEKHTYSDRYNHLSVMSYTFVGYRRQPQDKGFVFRINAGPIYAERRILPFLGLSFGFVRR